MINQLKIEVGDTVRIAKTSGYYNSCFKNNPMCEGVVVEDCGPLDVDWDNGFSNTYQSYDLTLIKKGKTMQFTKSDLKTGMFVKFRRGDYRIVLGDCALDAVSRCCLLNLKDNLLAAHDMLDSIDIMSVYNINAHTSITDHLNGKNLTLIWERTELTPAQKEMEVLQAKMNELQEQIKVVQAKL
jgi:hypothetical protein